MSEGTNAASANVFKPAFENSRLQQLHERREELALVRDILMLQVEIDELRNLQKTDNGDTDTKEGETGEPVSNG